MADDGRRDSTTGQQVAREVANLATDATVNVRRPEPAFDAFGATLDHTSRPPDGTLDLPASDQVAKAGDLDPGQVIGRFVIRSRLGEGGMGIVLAGHDADLGRPVAIKVVKSVDDHPAYRARLLREAQVMARLEHPNVVRVYEVGTDRGRLYVAMELVDGVTLWNWLKVERRPWREIVAMFEQVGRGLAAVHASGLVHRDFKPDNVLVDRDGRARVADFGLARLDPERTTMSPELAASLTRTGMMVGTPAYMAPEQHFGGAVDARADQYSFCIALREALIGHRPIKIEEAHWREVPRAVRAAIDKGASVDADERFPSMTALLDAIARGKHRRAIVLGASAAAVVAIGGVVAFAVVSSTGDNASDTRVAAAEVTAPSPTPTSPSPASPTATTSTTTPSSSTSPTTTTSTSSTTSSSPPPSSTSSPSPAPGATLAKPAAKTVAKPGATTNTITTTAAVGETTITPMAPVAETAKAKQHNVDGGKPPKHEMIAGHRPAVRAAVRDFGFGGVTITGDDLEGDRRETQAKVDAESDDLVRGVLLYGLGQLERKHDNCIGASKHWMEARKLILAASRGPIDTEQNRARRDQAFRFYGRVMIGEAFCDLQMGRALGVEEKLLSGVRNLFGVGDGERAEAWFAMGIALVETGELERGREMLLQAGRRGGSEKLRTAIHAYAAAVGVTL